MARIVVSRRAAASCPGSVSFGPYDVIAADMRLVVVHRVTTAA